MNDLGTPDVGPRRGKKSGGLFEKVLAPLSSVWFGVAVLALLFVYCSIGSAVPPFRQSPLFEMTEFEWFNWWPFDLLVAILCLSLIVITIRRIPFRLVNAGVWMIHGGVLVLCLGSYIYFSTKVEGDAPVFRRRVEIRAPGMTEPVHVVAVPGAQVAADIGPDRWRFRVQSTNTDWPILSEGFKGQKAYAVNVMVERPGEEPFVRQLLAGYPQFTEDVIPGKGRAIKSIGRKLVAPDLDMTLGYEPTEYFHVMDTWALYARRVGDKEWVQHPIHHMPRYHEHIGDRGLVAGSSDLPLRPLDIVVPTRGKGDPLANAKVRVTGYLPYAVMQRNWLDGGTQFNPMLRITIHAPQGAHQSTELFALDPAHSKIESGFVAFTWVPDQAALDRLPKSVGATLHVSVPASEKALDIALDDTTVVGADGAFTPIEGADFSFRVTAVQDNLSIGGRVVSLVIVDVKSPEGLFTRWVFDDDRLNRDHRGSDAHGTGGDNTTEPDARIKMHYEPAVAPVLFAAVGETPPALFVSRVVGEKRTIEPIAVGGRLSLGRGFAVSADTLLLRARSETKPFVVAKENRNRDVKAGLSMIRLEVDSGGDVDREWMRYNHYAFDDPQYAASGGFSYLPKVIRLADGTHVELMFSRERRKLPNPIALDDFRLKTHIGGFTGQANTVLNYVSHLRFRGDAGWSEPVPIEVNSPTAFGGLWYFQSTWDPPRPGVPGSGMNHTGLGVGNRHGVHLQLAGCCISVAGMIFAFYVKPVIRRRRAMRSMAKVGADREKSGKEPAEREVASVV